ncbi:hypothetical protein GCK72_017603 [Caenorhabditis remanei]|uniref:F-box domain-containing protein n=1 Tax=Caenorhabditis remanei TaxID=31234 RepID=A0A6A5G8H1_CAERE|nr:hypothetical protein GCK72_017603 [Caenorhabditis remanei]KAF1751051.1 hypothetical protein GCK72_017603 [Caenorhabditis remanei]
MTSFEPEQVDVGLMQTGLLTMPDLVERRILDNVGFLALIQLRKVCRYLRDRIEKVNPDYGVESIYLAYYRSSIRTYIDSTDGSKIKLILAKCGDDTLIQWDKRDARKTMLIKNEEIGASFWKILEPIFVNQKTPLTSFTLEESYFNVFQDTQFDEYFNDTTGDTICSKCGHQLEKDGHGVFHLRKLNKDTRHARIEEHLERLRCMMGSRKKLLEVDNLILDGIKQEQLYIMSTYINMKKVKTIDIEDFRSEERNIRFDLKGLDSIETLSLFGPYLAAPIHPFNSIRSIHCAVATIDPNLIMELKKVISTSPSLQDYGLSYDTINEEEEMYRRLGPDTTGEWFYSLKGTNMILCISNNDDCFIRFQKIEKSKLPVNAIIQ